MSEQAQITESPNLTDALAQEGLVLVQSKPNFLKKATTRLLPVTAVIALACSGVRGNIETVPVATAQVAPTSIAEVISLPTPTAIISPTETPEPEIAPVTPTVTPETIPTPIPATHAPTPTPSPTETPKPEYSYVYASGLIKIAIDKSGAPVSYTSADGETVSFDQEKIEELRQEAIATKEPVVINMIPLPQSDTPNPAYLDQYSPEHPKVDELPEDTLSDEQLAEKGIRIVQAPNTSLHIRQGAFEKGGQFEDLLNEKKNITIVLVDGPTVAANYMQDPRYAEFFNHHVPQIEGSISQFRDRIIARSQEGLEYLRKNEKPENYESLLLDAKIAINNYQTMTDEEIAKFMPSEAVSGRYIYTYDYDRDSNFNRLSTIPTKKSFIFIAVGTNITYPEYSVLYFDSNGNFDNTKKFYNGLDSTPQPKYTHPNPDELYKNPNVSPSNPYIYMDPNIGLTLEHEEAHRQFYEKNIEEGISHEDGERNADLEAGRRLAEAWEKWEKSGYTDNSGYNFVFSLPPEKGGGYILVGNMKDRPNLPKAF